jgi:hypothetical protein
MTLIGQTAQNHRIVRLNDTAGSDAFIVEDAHGFPSFKAWSNGDYGFRGKVKRV